MYRRQIPWIRNLWSIQKNRKKKAILVLMEILITFHIWVPWNAERVKLVNHRADALDFTTLVLYKL